MKETGVKHINPTGIFDPTPFAFCHSVQVPSQANLVFISGQSEGVGEGHLLAEDFASQVKSALENLQIILESHAATPAHVVKITVLIVDHNPQKLEIWTSMAKEFWKGYDLPASTLIPVPTLALPGMLIEVDAIAAVSEY